MESKIRQIEMEDRKKASFDYMLADLIGRSVSRAHHSANKMPKLSEAYPSLFSKEEEEEKAQERKDQLSALRFKQFAKLHNARFKEGSKQ